MVSVVQMKKDYHFTNVNPERDFSVAQYEDLRFIQEGDPSPDGKVQFFLQKELRLVMFLNLGTRYSEAMNATYLDENGKSQPMIMGCYGIGVSRTIAAVAEQFNDEKGLMWPDKVAPYQVHLIPVNMKDEAQTALSRRNYINLETARL